MNPETAATGSRGTNGPRDNITSYSWDWGDGNIPVPSPDPVGTHTYASPFNYTVTLNVRDSYGAIGTDSIVLNVVPVPPALPPIFVEFHWKHRVSLTTPGLGAGTQTFVAGINNPNNSTILYVSIRISGADQTGSVAFRVTSARLRLLPLETLSNIPVTLTLQPSDVGLTFTCTAVLLWGLSQASIDMTSTLREAGRPNIVTFTVITQSM